MDKEKIIEILLGWNFWKKSQDTGIYRPKYLMGLEKLLSTEQVVFVTGVRRSGKSTLMKQLIKKKIEEGAKKESFLYVNFEEPRFSGMLLTEFMQEIYDAYTEIINVSSEKPYILLDEVHNLPGWEKFVRAMHEKKEAHVIVSGSNSRMLSKEFGTIMTGRWVELKVYPLSFKEFLEFRKTHIKTKVDLLSQKNQIKSLLREYLEYGGLPLVVLKEEKEEITSKYFEDIVVRDIGERNRIKSLDKLKELIRYYFTSFASLISYRKAAGFTKLSLDSVERFSEYARDAHLLYFIKKFSYSLREQEVNNRKVYCVDNGLLNSCGYRFSENIGRLYENAVFLHLLQNKLEIYYYKDKHECDFIIKEGRNLTLAMQVTYKLGENKAREVAGLLEAAKALKIKEGLIISEDYEGREEVGGVKITYTPLWKYLLEKYSQGKKE